MKQWFESLQVRERRMILLAVVVVVVTLLYMYVWEPLTAGYDMAKADVERKTLLLSDARRNLGKDIIDGDLVVTPPSNQSLTLLVANTISTAGLKQAYKSSSPTGNDELRVALENASFDVLVDWLGQLQNAHRVVVTSGSFSNRNETGRVDASLVLQRLP